MELINFFKRSPVKIMFGILLIAMFAVKSCELFVGYCCAHTKTVSADNPGETENRNLGEDCFEKTAKKLYSYFDNAIPFRSVVWATPLCKPRCGYSFSFFTEPLRVVITPPPDIA